MYTHFVGAGTLTSVYSRQCNPHFCPIHNAKLCIHDSSQHSGERSTYIRTSPQSTNRSAETGLCHYQNSDSTQAVTFPPHSLTLSPSSFISCSFEKGET